MLVASIALATLAAPLPVRSAPAPVRPVAQEAAAQDHTGLVPADAAVLVRLESIDAAHATLTRLAALFDAPDSVPEKGALLDDVFGLPVGADGVDTTRPVYIGMDVTLGQPLMTALLPASDATAILAAAAEAGAQAFQRGDWVAVTTKPGYEPADVNPKLAAMQPGVLSVHVDLEALLELYGGLAEMMLAQAESSMPASPPSGDGLDQARMMEMVFDGFRLFMDCAESMDLALHEDGHELALSGRYTALEGSDLADLTDRLPLPETLPVAPDPEAQFVYLLSADWGELMEVGGPLIDDFVEAYPESIRAGLRTYMEVLTGVYQQLGSTGIGLGNLLPGGMEFAFYTTTAEGAETAAGIVAALEGSRDSLAAMGVSFGEPQPLELDGITVTQLALSIDYDRIVELSMVETPGVDIEAAKAAAREMMQSLYGDHPTVSIAQDGRRLCVNLGSDEGRMQSTVARLKEEPVSASPFLAGLYGLPPAANPLLAYRVDFAEWIRQAGPMMGAAGELPELPDAPLDTTFWMGLDGRHWAGGLTLDAEQLQRFAAAVQGK